MRHVLAAIFWAGLAGWAMASDGTDVFRVPGQAPEDPEANPPAPPKNGGLVTTGVSGNSPAGPAATSETPLQMILGAWTGTVNEVDADPYTIKLTFRPGGVGEVTYVGYDCRGLLSLASEVPDLTFRETITQGRDICADGIVKIWITGAEMTWVWINEGNEIQAQALLRRTK